MEERGKDKMRKITKDTQLCISIAARPGNFGTVFFNELFGKLGLDFLYKAFKVEPKNLSAAIAAIRALGIRGAGVSMPHKQTAMKYLDVVDAKAKKIGAINTIVNRQGKLIGYNMDYYGAVAALKKISSVNKKRVMLIGAGGIARAIAMALKDLKVRNVTVINRDSNKAKSIAKAFGFRYHSYTKKVEITGDLLINATSMGMSSEDGLILEYQDLRKFKAVIDVIVSTKKSKLIQTAEKLGLQAVTGITITTGQATAQFKLYTGITPSNKLVKAAINSYFRK